MNTNHDEPVVKDGNTAVSVVLVFIFDVIVFGVAVWLAIRLVIMLAGGG